MVSCFDFPVSFFLKVIFCWCWRSHRSSNRKSVKSKPQYIPPEVWEKIFLRLPAKSLVKCICVCKVWKSIITDQAFILSHFSHKAKANNNENDSLFLQYQVLTPRKYRSMCFGLPYQRRHIPIEQRLKSEQHLSVRSDDKEANCLAIVASSITYSCLSDLEVVGTCNGLVCFVKYSQSLEFDGIIIMNLSIRKYIVLPEPDDEGLTIPYNYPWQRALFGFGFDSKNNDFKVVLLVLSLSERQRRTLRVEVYSLATGKWSGIGHELASFICYCFYGRTTRRKIIFVNGALHWIFCGKCNNHHRSYISTFDLAEETFGEMMLPNFLDESCFGVSLLVRGNCLALTYQKYSAQHELTYIVCVMKEYGVVDSWDVVFSVGATEYPGIMRVMALTSSEKVVAETYDSRTLLLDADLNKETVKDFRLKKYWLDFAADHVESLFLINQENSAYDNDEDVIDIRFVSPK